MNIPVNQRENGCLEITKEHIETFLNNTNEVRILGEWWYEIGAVIVDPEETIIISSPTENSKNLYQIINSISSPQLRIDYGICGKCEIDGTIYVKFASDYDATMFMLAV